MASFNRVVLVGNLTRDPQLKYLPSQTAVCEFGMAMNRKFKTASGEDRDEVCFVDVSAFGRQAEVLNQYCQKGKLILVEGRLKYDQWEDKQGGGKRSKLTVVVENFQFLGGRDGGGAGGGGGGGGYDQSAGDPDDAPPRQAPRSAPPRGAAPQQNRPAPPPRQQPPAPAAEQPFGDEQQFNEDDIPF